MKKIKLVFWVTLFFSTTNFAKDFKISEVSVYSGKSPLSSGIGVSVVCKSETHELNLGFNATMAQVVYTKKYGLVSFGPSFGQKNNTPWFAPMLVIKPLNFLTITSWNGIFAGEPNKPAWKINFGFAFQSASIKLFPRFNMGWSVLHYMKDRPMNILFAKHSMSFDRVIVETTASFNLRDQQPLFLVAGGYKF